MTEPQPVADLDAGLDHLIRSGRRVLPSVLIFLTCLVVILGVGVGYLLFNARDERQRIDDRVRTTVAKECNFFRHTGSFDLPAQSTALVVQFVVDARNVTVELSCTPGLSPPSPTLRSLADKYQLRLEG